MARRPHRGQRGFSLLEVLLALAIVVALAGVAVFIALGATDRSRNAACDDDRRALRTAVEVYRATTGYLPANQGFLVPDYLDSPTSRWVYQPPIDLKTGTPTYVPTAECDP